MKRTPMLLIITLVALALGTATACIVRTRPARTHHGSTVHPHGHGKHKKVKKVKKIKKHKKYKD